MDSMELTASIHKAALECGFAACGIVRTEEMHGYADAIAERIAAFPESHPMYAPMAAFAQPETQFPWAKSVIVLANWYGKYHIPENLNGKIAKSFCVDTRQDPHAQEYRDRDAFAAALGALGLRHESKRDYGITAVRWAAARAGIGIIRKNNFFYTEQGSWNRLDAFLIDRELELKASPAIKSCPEKCGLCIRACPSRALSAPLKMNGVACVSFLTSKGTCAPGKPHYDECGSWIFGCDACQDACPFNKNAWSATEDYPGLKELAAKLSYEQILAMDYPAMRALLPPKFWYIGPESVWKWKCNVLNAMRNAYREDYLPHIGRATRDEQAEVREMAEWVLESVAGVPGARIPSTSIA